jgi:hypothetical protein
MAVLLMTSLSFAIEKKVVNKENKTAIEGVDSANIGIQAPAKSDDDTSTVKPKTKIKQKEFDDFVDKNNNGIDDRSEKKKEKAKTEKTEGPKK